MDWNKVNWFAFFPPLFSIYLMLISGLAGSYLAHQVQHAVDREVLKGHMDFVRYLAAGWAAQLGFVNAMIASLISAISVWSGSASFVGLGITVAILVSVFAPMLWYLFTHEPDQIVAIKTKPTGMTVAAICKVTLLFVNIVLIIAIAVNQQLK